MDYGLASPSSESSGVSSSITVHRFGHMATRTPKLAKVFALLRRVVDSNASVLVIGETGTGKELVARGLHETSIRRRSPFVPLNCGGLNPSLIESELFGHEKGSFTGAAGRRPGAFEQADTGTLFLDEIGELPLELQPRLLRALDSGEVRRVGACGSIHVDVRVVAATNRDLAADVAEGRFRADLFYRLNVIHVGLPPLRERRRDFNLLVESLLEDFGRPRLSDEAQELLEGHSWPGNVRELKNVLTRAALLAEAGEIAVGDIELPELQARTGLTLKEAQREHVLEVLASCDGNRAAAARKLGIARSTLHDRLCRYRSQSV